MNLKSILTATLIGIMSITTSNADELKVGDGAPKFSLKGSDGKTYNLADFKDKQAVVVAWFPKAFTGGWTVECQSFRANDAIKKFDVAYFTASCDSEEDNAKFAKELDLDYPILSDPKKDTAEKYGVVTAERAVPFRWTFYIGKDGKILHIDKEVSPKDAGEAVAKKLAELKVDEKK
jgi:peroxiredoxin Q/BCP